MEGQTVTLDRNIMREVMRETYAHAAELHELAAKPALSPDEVSKLYGISVSSLEKMRADNRGPAYVNLGRKILYSAKAIQKWLDAQTIEPRNI